MANAESDNKSIQFGIQVLLENTRSAANIIFMRQFYEAWEPYFKSLTTVSETQENIIDAELLFPVEEKLGISLNEFLSLESKLRNALPDVEELRKLL